MSTGLHRNIFLVVFLKFVVPLVVPIAICRVLLFWRPESLTSHREWCPAGLQEGVFLGGVSWGTWPGGSPLEETSSSHDGVTAMFPTLRSPHLSPNTLLSAGRGGGQSGKGRTLLCACGFPSTGCWLVHKAVEALRTWRVRARCWATVLAYQPARLGGALSQGCSCILYDGIENRGECLLLWLKLICTVLQKTFSTHLKIRPCFSWITFTISPLPLCSRKYLL